MRGLYNDDMFMLLKRVFLGLLLVLSAACAGASSEVQDQTAVQGPALLMFYTDN